MKRLGIIVGAIVGLFVVVAVAAPLFIDLNQYKGMISEQAEAATGRKLEVQGDISLSLLTGPGVTVSDVVLFNDPRSADKEMARIDSASVKVAVLPLLSGTVKLASASLEGAKIVYEQYADGTNNLPMPKQDAAAEEAPTPAADEESGGMAFDLAIDSFRIEDVTLIYRDVAAGSEQVVTLDDTEISMGSLTGPFDVDGKVAAMGLSLGFEANVGAMGGAAMPVNVRLLESASGMDLALNLSVTNLETDPAAQGGLNLTVDDLGALAAVASGGKAARADNPLPLEVSAKLDGSTKAAKLNDLVVKLGEESLKGSVSVTMGDLTRFAVALNAGSIDAEKLMAQMASLSGGGGDKAPADALASPAEAAPFALPDNVAGTVKVSIDAISYQELAARQVSLNARLEGGVLHIENTGAKLPSSTNLDFDGRLKAVNGAPSFSALLSLNTPDLRGLLTAAGTDVSSVPVGKLGLFRARVPLAANAEKVRIKGMEIKLDGSTFTGDMLAAIAGVRPEVTADLALDRINADDYMASESAAADANADAPSQAAEGGSAALPPILANVNLSVGSLTLSGTTLNNTRIGVKADIAEKGAAKINVDGSLGSTSLTLAATMPDSGNPMKAMDVKASLSNPSARAFAAPFKGMLMGPPVYADGPVSYDVTAKGKDGDIALSFVASSKVGSLMLQGDVNDADKDPSLDLALTGTAKEFSSLFTSLGLPYDPKGRRMGAFNLNAGVKGSMQAMTIGLDEFKIGEDWLKGSVALDMPKGGKMAVDANFTAGTLDVDQLMPRDQGGAQQSAQAANTDQSERAPGTPPWSKDPIDFSAMRNVDASAKFTAERFLGMGLDVKDAKLDFVLKDGIAELKTLTGLLYDGPFDMKAKLDGSGSEAVFDMNATLDKADIAQASMALADKKAATGQLDATMNLSGRGVSQQTLVESLNGKAIFNAKDGAIQGIDLQKLAAAIKDMANGSFSGLAAAAFQGGETPYRDMNMWFEIADGIMRTKEAKTDIINGELKLDATVDLPLWKMLAKGDLYVASDENIPPVSIYLEGPVDAPQRRVDLSALTRYATQKAVGRGIESLFGNKKTEQPPADGATEPAPEGDSANGTQSQQDTKPTPQDMLKNMFSR